MAELRFDLEALRDRLGDRRFRRAEAYAERGAVRLLAVEGDTAFAFVSGEAGSTYAVELKTSGEGRCACPDFAETQACKHLGALALTAEGLAARPGRGLGGRLSRLRESLEFEEAAGLRDLVLRLAIRVPGALEALEGEGEG